MRNEKKHEVHDFEVPYFSIPILLLICVALTLFTAWPLLSSAIRSHHYEWWPYASIAATFCGYAMLVSLVDYATKALDKSCRWNELFYKRLYLQLLFGWAAPLILSLLITWLYFFLLGLNISNTLYTEHTFFLILFITLMLNALYMGTYFSWFLNEGRKITDKKGGDNTDNTVTQVQTTRDYRMYFMIPNGHDKIQVSCTDIAYLFRDGRDMLLKTHDGEVSIFWQSLEKIEQELDPYCFCRVSRSYIISRTAFLQYEELSGGGILILLKQNTEGPIKVSRDKAQFVKDWLNEDIVFQHPPL